MKGEAGADGAVGAKGQKGEIGETGPMGIQGIIGVAGEKGMKVKTHMHKLKCYLYQQLQYLKHSHENILIHMYSFYTSTPVWSAISPLLSTCRVNQVIMDLMDLMEREVNQVLMV